MNYSALLQSDWKNIGRDPMLLMSIVAPWLIMAMAVFLFPIVSTLSSTYFHFPLEAYYPFGYLFLMPIIPMLFGMVYGFILLDERDGGIISYLAITPLGKSGYLTVRMLMPVLVSFAFCLIYLPVTGFLNGHPLALKLLLAAILSSEAPLILLFVASYADNKVEGIAISKGFGILLLSIILDYFLKGDWRYLLAVSPLWWVERTVFYPENQWFYLAGAFVMHAAYIALLYRKFSRKFD
jgi:fluoroquinolone transport system permease protein